MAFCPSANSLIFDVWWSQDSIIRICVDSDGARGKVLKKKSSETIKATSSEEMDDDYETEAVLSSELEGVDDGLQEDLQGIGENEDEELLTDGTLSDDLTGRRLLGSAMRVLLATGGGGGVCSEGKESFWSIRTIHETHIFIFTLAVVHIVFAGLSMVLCSWKVCICHLRFRGTMSRQGCGIQVVDDTS